MNLEILILSEVNQIKTNIQQHLNVKSIRVIQMNLQIRQKKIHSHRKQTFGYQSG